MCECATVCVFVIYCLMSLFLIAHKLQLQLERSGCVGEEGVGYNIWQLIYDSYADVLVQLPLRALGLKSNEQIELPTEHRAKLTCSGQAEQFACVSFVLSYILLTTVCPHPCPVSRIPYPVSHVPFAATLLRCVIDHCDISQAAHSANT